MVHHGSLTNLVDWVNREFAVTPADRLLWVTSPGFDLSVYDLFGIWAAGASVRVATAPELDDATVLGELLCQEGITFWDSAPAALGRLLPFLAEMGSPDLRRVFLSGDWIPVTMPDQIRRHFPHAEVVALGGATEATVWSNSYRIGAVDPAWPSIPYGRPMQNARYYVLDEDLRELPIGVEGDLYIAGACVAAGYHDRPELNAERFLADSVHGEPGERNVRDRRPRPVDGGRQPAVPRSPGPAGQDPRPPHRTGRGRERARAPAGGGAGLRHRRAGQIGRAPPGRLHRRRHGPDRTRDAHTAGGGAAGRAGAGEHHHAAGHAGDRQRQAGPRRPAATRAGHHRRRAAADPRAARNRRRLAGDPRSRRGEPGRRLLPPRRQLAERLAGGRPPARQPARRPAPARLLPRADGARAWPTPSPPPRRCRRWTGPAPRAVWRGCR